MIKRSESLPLKVYYKEKFLCAVLNDKEFFFSTDCKERKYVDMYMSGIGYSKKEYKITTKPPFGKYEYCRIWIVPDAMTYMFLNETGRRFK